MDKSLTTQNGNAIYTKIVLSHLEIFYLRLFTHGLEPKEIIDFLELNHGNLNQIRASLKQKFKTDNWTKLICTAFKHNYLQKTDFLDSIIKDIALEKTQIIFKSYLIGMPPNFTLNDLNQELLDFYSLSKKKTRDLYDEKNESDKLTLLEIKLINFKFKELPFNDILQQLGISKLKYEAIKKRVFLKLGTNNWFNTFKKAHQLNIINRPNEKESSLEKEVSICSNKISRLRFLKRLLPLEKKLSIYNELLELYSNIELINLLNDEQ